MENKSIAQDQSGQTEMQQAASAPEEALENKQTVDLVKSENNERMVAYEAELYITVKGLENIVRQFQQEIEKTGGYLIESSVYDVGEGRKSATILGRVPQQSFQQFLSFIESKSEKIKERNVRGQDVTEEYVDLDSRLKAKTLVEERLLSFMKNAQKTEDLLKISKDLGQVQEEIEQIEGRMKYLQNRTSYASITIHIEDAEVVIPALNKEELNTWQQAKKTFIETINGLKRLCSSFIIVVIGFSPVLFIIGVVAIIAWMFLRRKKKSKEN